jgi:hypothetical protein
MVVEPHPPQVVNDRPNRLAGYRYLLLVLGWLPLAVEDSSLGLLYCGDGERIRISNMYLEYDGFHAGEKHQQLKPRHYI